MTAALTHILTGVADRGVAGHRCCRWRKVGSPVKHLLSRWKTWASGYK